MLRSLAEGIYLSAVEMESKTSFGRGKFLSIFSMGLAVVVC